LREDPNKPGLLFAGTERGVYVSFNDGDSWQKLNLNLPLTPIRDLKFKKRKGFNCCYAWTCFWVLDDITPLYEIKDKTIKGDKHLFKPRPAYRMQGGQSDDMSSGTNKWSNCSLLFKKKPSSEIKLQF
jgi:hypothetical protein